MVLGKKAQAIEKSIKITSNILNAISWGMLFVMMLLGAFDVIGRYFFNRPITGTSEISEILLAGIVFFSWAHTQGQGAHIRVNILVSHFPNRIQAVINFIICILSLVLFGLILWQGLKIAGVYWEAQRLIDVINIPIAPFVLFVPLGALALCLELIVEMLHLASQMTRSR